MNAKVGRNDSCPCGSGKKYKQCCMNKTTKGKKLKAKWLNAPAGPNLMERTFGSSIASTGKNFKPVASNEETTSDEKRAEPPHDSQEE
jgi:uncharacterized protein